jgi:TRAP-type C4-dicarboxylate transport system substrate-binding protein
MSTRCKFAMSFLSVLIVGVCFLGGYAAAASEKPIVLRFAGTMPATHVVTKSQFKLSELVAEKTGGGVKIEVYPSGQLYSALEIPPAVSSGVLPIGTFSAAAAATIVPLFDGPNNAFLIDSWDHFDRLVDSEAYEKMMADACKKARWYHLCSVGYGELSGPITKKSVRTLEDLKGLKIRCPGRAEAEGFRALGASPVDMDSGEVYAALQRGTIDGAFSGYSTYYPRKWCEVAKYIADAHYHFGDWPIVFNLETWNKLPKNFQRVIKECALKIQDETRKAMRAQDQEYIKKLKEAGVEIYTLPPAERAKWAKAARPAWDEWIKLVGKEKADKFFELAEKLR